MNNILEFIKIDRIAKLPRYYQLAEELKAIISRKIIAKDQTLPSDFELMQHLNLSRSTVRQAINILVADGLVSREQGKGTFLREPPARVKKAKELMVQIVYNPSSVSKDDNPVYWFISFDILQGVIAGCNEFGCRPVLVDYRKSREVKGDYIIVIRGSLEDVRELGVKAHVMVLPYDPYPEIQCNNVIADWEQGGYAGVRHLLDLGHRRIGYLDAEPGPSDLKVSLRGKGYQRALEEKGLFSAELIRPCGLEERVVRDAVDSLLDLKDRPTALFATNDYKALSAMRAIQGRGLRVPEDIAVVGYDDILEAATAMPPLTTLESPRYECGYEAVRLLKDLVSGKRRAPQKIVIAGRLVVRESCGAHLAKK